MRATLDPPRDICLLLVLSTFLIVTAAQRDGPVTVYQNRHFSSLRSCAQNCFVLTYSTTRDLLGPRLRCSISTMKYSRLALNNCYCRPDLREDAHHLISSCVSQRCPFNDNDIATAQFVYDDYCAANGYLNSAGAQSPVPTADAGGNGREGQGDNGDGTGPNAAPGAGRTGGQTMPTGTSRSAADRSWAVPARLVVLLMGTVAYGIWNIG